MEEDTLKLEVFDLYVDNKNIPGQTTFTSVNLYENKIPFMVKVSLKETIKQYYKIHKENSYYFIIFK